MRAEPPDYLEPETGAVLTHLLIIRDVDRSREFYERVLGATVIHEREPGILRFQNSYIVLNTEGGPTDDKPDVQAQAPPNSNTLSSAMNIRVNDVQVTYEKWRSRGGEFLTPPKDHELEIRCYLRDPDGSAGRSWRSSSSSFSMVWSVFGGLPPPFLGLRDSPRLAILT